MNISINKSFEILDEYYFPDLIRTHCISVCKVATFLSQKYFEKELINRKTQMLIIISALLHDLTKLTQVKDFETRYAVEHKDKPNEVNFWRELRKKHNSIKHEESAYLELKDKYPEIAKIIRAHLYFNVNNLNNISEKILYYADKRDDFGEIKNVTDRMTRSHLRYLHEINSREDWIKLINTDNKILDLEKELFLNINEFPEECNKLNKISLDDLFKQFNIDKELEVDG
jgi:hypothetical protein